MAAPPRRGPRGHRGPDPRSDDPPRHPGGPCGDRLRPPGTDVEIGGVADPRSPPARGRAGAYPRLLDLARIAYGEHRHALTLGVAIALGAVLRLWHLNAHGFNTDEAVYAGQAASIAGDEDLQQYFPVFRAHPLLFQSLLSVPYQLGTSDLVGRLLAVAIGVATIVLVHELGRLLYGPSAGVVAALLIALMPYHVVVTRQVLLDGPLTLFATLALFTLAKFGTTRRVAWLHATGAAMGLTFLSKETGILLVGAIYAFLALTPELRVRVRDLAVSLGVMLLVILPFPLSLLFAGKAGTGGQFLSWQLFRRPNHAWSFYPTEVPPAVGPLLIACALAGVVLLWHRRSWRETLLLCWIATPVVFFQIWPVKGFQYLLPAAPAMAVLAARALSAVRLPQDLAVRGRRLSAAALSPALVVVVCLTLAIPSVARVQPSTSETFLAGSGGVPGGREAGRWIDANTPAGARLLTVGPSMANVLQFYGHRRAFGLSVSPNPLHRNPVYEPIVNPDLRIRHNDLQYVVWDAFSANRSPFFSSRLLRYAERYHGRAIHTEWVDVSSGDGTVRKPVIRIYEVRP